MGIVAERSGILPQLRETVKQVPVFVRRLLTRGVPLCVPLHVTL